MSRVRLSHRENKIKHRSTLLAFVPILLEYARPVRKGVSDWGIEVRDDAPEQRACQVGHRQKLISAKSRR